MDTTINQPSGAFFAIQTKGQYLHSIVATPGQYTWTDDPQQAMPFDTRKQADQVRVHLFGYCPDYITTFIF